jgi:oxygen-independent coproporphyrinogen III oxidase
MDNLISLYIHIPFCKAKCHYCDFNSYPGIEELIPSYFATMEKEIFYYSKLLENYSVKTVFIGGGTPSLVDPSYIYNIINLCRRCFDIVENAETSIESNPGTLTFEKLLSYRSMGINRLSIGLQAWQDNILEKLGRIHTACDFEENMLQARKAGFDNINVDLIFGIPDQQLIDWLVTLSNMIRLDVPHLSCYSLKIEEETVLHNRMKSGLLKPVEDEVDREMYHELVEILKKANCNRYEISNFSKPGYECKHNLNYWQTGRYIGLGAGAHSYFKRTRYNNTNSVSKYINSNAGPEILLENKQEIDNNEEIVEYIILGLRLAEGIHKDEFAKKFKKDIYSLYRSEICKLLGNQLLEEENGRLRLSPLGFDLANQVFVEFLQ